MKKLIFTVLFFSMVLFSSKVFAEYIYMNDGQVIQGTIVSEDADTMTVKTKYQTKKINRSDVLRVMYGERKMERIYLLMKDGTTIKGFLVDQDAEKVVIRETEESPKETSISKDKIKQMSANEIVPLNPSITIHSGLFYPLNSGGSNLKPAFLITAASELNFRWIKKTRVSAEVGFARCSSSNKDLYMQFVPIQLGATYDINFNKFYIIPKFSIGATIIDFDDGEGSATRSIAFSTNIGSAFLYEIIERHLYAGIWTDAGFIRDGGGSLFTISGTVGASYRF